MASSSVELGTHIRMARKDKGLTIAQLASQIGRPREWLNRVELGYSEYGEHKPANQSELRILLRYIEDTLSVSAEELLRLGKKAEDAYRSTRHRYGRGGRESHGRLTQAEVILGEEEVVEAIVNLIHAQDSQAVLRNTGVREANNTQYSSEVWSRYRKTLGQFLTDNPNALMKRVEYVQSAANLEISKQSDLKLAGSRDITEVHNAKVKFRTQNPFQLNVLIGEHEAILGLPHPAGNPGSNMALLIRDKQFVEALRMWYDEVLWEGNDVSQMVRFSEFDQSFREIAEMYGIDPPAEPAN